MKKVTRLLIIVIGVLSFSSCAVHNGYMNNSAFLSQANFSYVNTNISGTASTLKILGIGGLEKQAIVAEAKSDMLKKHHLKPNQTLANITVNWKMGFYFIVITNECTVTADIVEFYSNDEERKTSKTNINKKDEKINNTNPLEIKVGDKVKYKDAFKSHTGIIYKIEGNFYYIRYVNKKGIEKTIKTYGQTWIKKID